MEIHYEVEDGYVGGHRPQSFEISDSEIKDQAESVEDALRYIDECTQEDFENKVTFYYEDYLKMTEKIRILLEEDNA